MAKLTLPKDRVFITPSLLRVRYGGDFDPNIFKRWQDGNQIIKIRNGLYLNKGYDIRSEVDEYCISNKLYEPSYISTYSALHYYSLIPEQVYETIAVTTRKTKRFTVRDNRYVFHHLKPELFFGYEVIPWREHAYLIASPEKALLDLAYLEPRFSEPEWLEEMRFDEDGLKNDVDWQLMYYYAFKMKSQAVTNRIATLLNTYDI